MTDDQKKSQSERMKQYHADKKKAKEQPTYTETPAPKSPRELELERRVAELEAAQVATPAPAIIKIDEKVDGISEGEYRALKERVEELELSIRSGALSLKSGPQVSNRGSLIGTFEKYSMDPDAYDDPTSRLADEPKLLRVPFKSRAGSNGGYYEYDLVFSIMPVTYQTQDGVNTQEPRFILKLNRYIPDPETDEPTNFAYTACQLIFHEDPQAALVIARDNHIPIDQSNERKFLNEMRYLRMRDWLLEAFFPPKPNQERKVKQQVIANKLVDVFEVTSEQAERFDFSKLNHKL